MNPTQIFKFGRIRIYLKNRNLIRLPLGRIRARPSYTVARGPLPQCWLGPWHSARGPRLAGPASACAARDCAARRGARAHTGAVTALRACVMAGGGATVVEVEQRKALEHPRRRGHPRGMWVEAIAHRSFLSTGRAEKLG
jgi:hypothetical protein